MSAFIAFSVASGMALLIGLLMVGQMMKARRRNRLAEFALEKHLSFDPERDPRYSKRYPAFSMLQEGENRYAHNILYGDWGHYQIRAFDYHYETHTRDSKGRRRTNHHYFSAVIILPGLPLKPLMIRREGLFDKIAQFFGADDIDFESGEFSSKFHVKADDRKWAYDILHQRAIAFLLDQPRFTIQVDHDAILAWDKTRLTPEEFAAAADVVTGLLDMMPDYLRRELSGYAS